MRYGKYAGLVILLSLATLLSACNLGQQPEPTIDAGAVATSAVETVMAKAAAEQTQTALAGPPAMQSEATLLPTMTSVPTFAIPGTPQAGATELPTVVGLASPTSALLPQPTQAGPVCNDSVFISETVPDGTVFKPGEDFDKSWTLQNTGTCTWDEGYALVYQGGTLDGYTIQIDQKDEFTPSGSTQVFKVRLTASLEEREYTECWRMQDDKGYYFGTFVCVTIVVKK
jgi:hypothetical protein